MNRRSFFAALAAIPASVIGVFHVKRTWEKPWINQMYPEGHPGNPRDVVCSFNGGKSDYPYKSYLGQVTVKAERGIRAGDFVVWDADNGMVRKCPPGRCPHGIVFKDKA